MSHRTNPHKRPGASSNQASKRAAGERAKPDAKSDVKPGSKPDTKPDAKSGSKPDAKPDRNQGEGNITAARNYNEDQREFVAEGRVEDAARQAAPRNTDEERSMADAEREGRSHAREEDPSIPRDYRR
ncbi:hypothetical protein [Aquabacterium humicola]|uniref:hypothetical protein n=1 Tax=Aquabacterium humicola TaxID=3237377 RepID=UPI002543161F|nr:hypothetical protein [Rubrivivax pictus]